MLSSSRRFVLVIALLVVGAGLSWGQRWISAAKLASEFPPPAAGEGESASPAEDFIYFLDIEGWYRITPYETVVRSPHDLTGGTTAEMAAALPPMVGHWQQVGEDKDVGDDPAVVFYLKHPTVALQRTYRNPAGQNLTLVLIGNKGEDSYLLFSHTPETCYPGRLWQVIDSRQESAMLDDRPMHAQYLLTEQAETGDRLMVLYWYQWDNPQRDSRDGVLSVRVNLFLPPGASEEEVLALAWDFVRSLFPSTIPWDRF
jgi:EpsI family protein